jgi:ElaB/YqjD/DUF883 family membrane-anchored ribosome-binding protein
VQRPRDRSHYERFGAFHASFYRGVEATSVTPFSPRALDRALAAVVVAIARHGHAEMTKAEGALCAEEKRDELNFVADALAERAAGHAKFSGQAADELRQKVRKAVSGLLDDWAKIAREMSSTQSKLVYHREAKVGKSLLRDPLDSELRNLMSEAARFKAHRSMRDVEPTVNLWMKTLKGKDYEVTDK